MEKELRDKALKAALRETSAMLNENWEKIQEAFSEAYQDHCRQQNDGLIAENAKFKYPISLKVLQQPEAGDIRISAAIAWSVNRKDASIGTVVSNQPQLGI